MPAKWLTALAFSTASLNDASASSLSPNTSMRRRRRAQSSALRRRSSRTGRCQPCLQ
ncbi:hypothetical protein PF005_g21780 [Phytophthora fragariae]|uniref:Uncharacterized protein n=2 Tax=Phytophthora TaxID=4783 RepID=A0A6A3KRJ5_9STRA|nr:hypothetical protein PF003_g32046 [Phytophthora fragariae]KAE9041585.1 hypothetical protein PR002_g4373 [Phytophthora rubi]KAE8929101.1 hypothetical protein PF009_g20781 [Phytophthora fragariae]KAE9008028.1 hypothetical protein PF011_g10867 [Phytophthora fragariae]KAE9083689.1 hypothetical protein PF007_g21804 [Phytophthora fragariae]